jgi:hypothetical protein
MLAASGDCGRHRVEVGQADPAQDHRTGVDFLGRAEHHGAQPSA